MGLAVTLTMFGEILAAAAALGEAIFDTLERQTQWIGDMAPAGLS
jgi:hypothetical protein